MEALACREGLALAAEWVPSFSVLESDCAAVVKYLSSPSLQRSTSHFVIQEALEEASKLPSVVFRQVNRGQNGVAHELAQMAKRLRHSAVWRERVPVCIEQIVAQDVNSSVNP